MTLDEKKLNELITSLIDNKIVTKQGLLLSGNGIVIKELEKLNKMVEEIKVRLYYMEERQKKFMEYMERIQKFYKE